MEERDQKHVETSEMNTDLSTELGELDLDCYPYTFSPLLLFTQGSYFDKGHSNYNSVAEFFRPGLSVDMLSNVLYERKNMGYEDLLEYVTKNQMIVTCCIDSHFTAFQVLKNHTLIWYDPLKSLLTYVSNDDSFKRFVLFMLLKCKYGDCQHVQENKDHYTGNNSNSTRRLIHTVWQKINKLTMDGLGIKIKQIELNLDRYLLINSSSNPKRMSTQETGNTCYFQTYLFAVLCKVCSPTLSRNGDSLDCHNVDMLEKITIDISRFLLEFFVKEKIMRPLTNSNFVCDFFRYQESRYYEVFTQYLAKRQVKIPSYKLQYRNVYKYLKDTMLLHKYGKFQVSGKMSSTLNSKALQAVVGVDDGRYKLCLFNYYKYRAANLMFGFNTNIMKKILCFSEFNALRKNQLLAFYELLKPTIKKPYTKMTKYRDYYFMPQFEIGQQELVDLHHYTYEIDLHSMMGKRADSTLAGRHFLLYFFFFFSVYLPCE